MGKKEKKQVKRKKRGGEADNSGGKEKITKVTAVEFLTSNLTPKTTQKRKRRKMQKHPVGRRGGRAKIEASNSAKKPIHNNNREGEERGRGSKANQEFSKGAGLLRKTDGESFPVAGKKKGKIEGSNKKETESHRIRGGVRRRAGSKRRRKNKGDE